MFNPGRTVFNYAALLVTYHVRIDSQRDAWVTVPQLLLHHSRGCTVCEQGTGCTVTCSVEPATWNAQLHQQQVKLFFS